MSKKDYYHIKSPGARDDAKVERKEGERLFSSMYDRETKERACQIYLYTGSLRKASIVLDVPYKTIWQWSQKDWFRDMYGELKARMHKKLDGKLTGMLNQMILQMEDRIKNGDEVITKGGVKMRKKIDAKVLSSMTEQIFRIIQLINGMPTQRTEHVTTTDKLNSLMDQLAERQQASREEKEEADKDVLH